MSQAAFWRPASIDRAALVHSIRTAVAAVVSLLLARLFRLPEAYWAAISTLVVMQSTLGAALTVSGQRFAGTALGAALGGVVASYFGSSVLAFSIAVFVAGLLCVVLRMDRSAYRFASITLAIVMLVSRTPAAWVVALHRFIEVSVGIAIGLALTALWPEPDAQAVPNR
ncbi:MAG TPA: FUSC family protein [Methylomirabilota bacterium]|nr:FUSC family protein [Methylomirabilota bacterium]